MNLDLICNSLSTGIVILNKERQIKFSNRYMQELIKPEFSNKESIGELFGDVFSCTHNHLTKGCGTTEHCEKCPLVNSVGTVLDFSQIVVFKKEFIRDMEAQEKEFYLFTLKPFIYENSHNILLEISPFQDKKIDRVLQYYTNLKEEIEVAQKKMYKDFLTDLHNRNFYEEKFKSIYDHQEKLSFLLIDVDNFKRYNDSKGHLAGDKLLFEISNMIKNELKEEDYGMRIGGDEFLISLNRDREEAYDLATTLIQKIKKNNRSLSIGIAEKKDSLESIESLFKRADRALYLAKDNGKGEVIIDGN